LNVLALVRRARRRILYNLLFYEGANAASAALFAFILLLILGTQVLAWYWAVLLPGAAAGFAIWRVRRRLPSEYVTAQRVDRRLQLADSLSTALYFSTQEADARVSSELRESQRAAADRVAAGVDVRQAVPYLLPRTAYITAALLLIGSSVFALRYGLTDKLDLKQPLAAILRESLGLPEKGQQARLDPRRDPDSLASDDPLATDQGQPTDPADQNQQTGDAAENYSTEAQKSAAKADAKSKNSEADSDVSDDGQADQSEQPSEGQQNGNPKDGQKDGKQSQSGGNSQQQNNQSLLSKMKEAMQNLMSSMQQNSRDQQQNSSKQNGKGSKGQQNQAKQQSKGEKSKSQSGDSQDQQAADESQEAQNTPGQSADQQDSPLANKQPGSGAGNRDGAKDMRQAEQLAAMGKISEIIGKRAANVTGEATVDVENTSQQLRTGYQDRRAEHAQTGAEIHRDEIPVALESYVEQYFEQVHKQNPGREH
jgi:hypothetical protein